MNHDRLLLQAITALDEAAWAGAVFRHMFASFSPDRENTLGARWNPAEIPAIYTSTSRDTALSEAEYQMGMESVRPPTRRTLYEIRVSLASVLDLSLVGALTSVGLTMDEVAANDHGACRRVGGAVEHLGHDGLFVPSARHGGRNLVIYPNRRKANYQFDVIDAEIIFDPTTKA